MVWRHSVTGLALLAVLAGCQGTEMAGEQEAATAAAATDADDDPTAEDGSGEIVGGGAGDVGGQLPDVGEFRNPRFGRGGLVRWPAQKADRSSVVRGRRAPQQLGRPVAMT